MDRATEMNIRTLFDRIRTLEAELSARKVVEANMLTQITFAVQRLDEAEKTVAYLRSEVRSRGSLEGHG